MADVVRLAIVYETSQAANSLRLLDTNISRVTTGQRKAGIAALQLAQSLESGSISAVGMAKSLGTVASFIFGPWGIALAFAVSIMTFFANRTTKAREEQRKFQNQIRDVQRDIDALLKPGGQAKTPFETEVERITDMITILDQKIQDANRSWTTFAQWGLAAALTQLGFPGAAAAILPKPLPESAQAEALRGKRALLTPEAERQSIQAVTAFEQRLGASLGRLLGQSQITIMEDSLARARKELEDLIRAGLDPLSEQALRAAASIRQGEDALRRMVRETQLLKSGLETLANTIEDFVVTGTLAFQDFLNNILRLLYRDFTGSIIDSIMRHHGVTPTGTGGTGSVEVGGSFGGPGPLGSVVTNVNFNVNTIDAASTAQFLESNGARIASIVAGQAGRSLAIRRKFQRG